MAKSFNDLKVAFKTEIWKNNKETGAELLETQFYDSENAARNAVFNYNFKYMTKDDPVCYVFMKYRGRAMYPL